MVAARPGWWESETLLPNLLLLIGVAAIVVPTCVDMFSEYWTFGYNGQSPVVLLTCAYLYWSNGMVFGGYSSRPGWAGPILAFGLLCFLIGRTTGFFQLEALSLCPFGYGICAFAGGDQAVRRLHFANLLLLAAVPLPGSLADALLVPLKTIISKLVVTMLALLHYPVGVDGVVISVGFSQLQIADACSGLWSLVSLLVVGILFEHFVGSSKRIVAATFLMLIGPIAVLTNLIRVTVLVLITYHFGSSAEEAFHDIAAFVEILLSLLLFAGTHFLLERLIGRCAMPPAQHAAA